MTRLKVCNLEQQYVNYHEHPSYLANGGQLTLPKMSTCVSLAGHPLNERQCSCDYGAVDACECVKGPEIGLLVKGRTHVDGLFNRVAVNGDNMADKLPRAPRDPPRDICSPPAQHEQLAQRASSNSCLFPTQIRKM